MKIFKIVFPLVTSGASVGCIGWLLRNHIQYRGIVEDLSSWGSFFTVFGVVYAIVAGFLLVTVLSRYSALNQTIEDELNVVESIRDFLVYLEDEQQIARTAKNRRSRLYEVTVHEGMGGDERPAHADEL